MITRDAPRISRIKRSFMAKRIASNKLLLYCLAFLTGLTRYNRKRNRKQFTEIPFPSKRLKMVLLPFVRRLSEQEQKELYNPIGLDEIYWSIDRLHTAVSNSDDFFGKYFFQHLMMSNWKLNLPSKYLLNLITYLAKQEITREGIDDKIFALSLDINERCNMKCKHCIASSSNKNRDLLELDKLINTLDFAVRHLGCRLISILGGEPFMDSDRLFSVLRAFPYTPIQIYTNGTLINDKMVSKLEEHPNVAVLVSLEGNESFTDRFRGPGCFNNVDSVFKLLKCSNIFFGASVTANRSNYKHIISDSFAEYLESSGVYLVWIFDYKDMGRAQGSKLDFPETQKDAFNNRVAHLNKTRRYLTINSEVGPNTIGGCPATKGTMLHILADGYVSPCVTQRLRIPDCNVKKLNLSQIAASEPFKAYRDMECFEGCPYKYARKKWFSWQKKYNVEPH